MGAAGTNHAASAMPAEDNFAREYDRSSGDVVELAGAYVSDQCAEILRKGGSNFGKLDLKAVLFGLATRLRWFASTSEWWNAAISKNSGETVVFGSCSPI